MARRRDTILKPKRLSFAIVVDGETEAWYFQMLKRNEPSLQINIKPIIPQKKKLSEQYDEVFGLAKEYLNVFWIIDLDVILKETAEAKEKEKPIDKLKKYIKDLEKHKNITIILNNPCLEFWFLLHFEQITKYFPKCEGSEEQLKKYLKNYEKTRKYFTKQDKGIYLQLKQNLSNAIHNAKNTNRKDDDNLKRALCEMNLFFENDKIKEAIFKESDTSDNL